jgi:hypothetical protein
MLKTLEMGIGQRQTQGSELVVEIVGVEVAVNIEERGGVLTLWMREQSSPSSEME